MKISKNAWHYRWIAKQWDSRPRSLCGYFWKLVWSLLFAFMGGALLGWIALAPILSWFRLLPSPIFELSLVFWTLGGGIALVVHRDYLYETGRLRKQYKPQKEPGVLRQFLTAQHRKVCPLVEYE